MSNSLRKRDMLKDALRLIRENLKISAEPFIENGKELINKAIPTSETDDFFTSRTEVLTQTGIRIREKLSNAKSKATIAAKEKANKKKDEFIRFLISSIENLDELDADNKTTLLCLACLLGELDEILEIKNPVKLLKGAKVLLQMEKKRRAEAHSIHVDDVLSKEERYNFNIYMQLSCAALGRKGLMVFGLLTPNEAKKVDSFLGAVEYLTNIPQQDVLHYVEKGKLYRPGHFIAVDHKHSKVVLTIRGTMRVHDVLVDLVCEQAEFSSYYDDSMEKIDGHAHKGMLICAQRLAEDLLPRIEQALDKFPDYDLVLTGHSLGGGVASLMTLIWSTVPALRERNIHAYSMASPCILSPELSQAPFTRSLITSTVFSDDIVSRVSFSSFQDLLFALGEMSKAKSLPFEKQLDTWNNLPRGSNEKKLYPGGRVWLLDSYEHNREPVEIDPLQHLSIIPLTKDIISTHMPGYQLNVVSGLYLAME